VFLEISHQQWRKADAVLGQQLTKFAEWDTGQMGQVQMVDADASSKLARDR
jgi:hypothetical protein